MVVVHGIRVAMRKMVVVDGILVAMRKMVVVDGNRRGWQYTDWVFREIRVLTSRISVVKI